MIELLENYEVGNFDSTIGTSEDLWIAQSFQISQVNKQCTNLQLELKNDGASSDLTVRLETDTSGEPSGTLVHPNATYNLPNAELGAGYAWENILFTPFDIKPGVDYWIVCKLKDGAEANHIDWHQDADGNYTGGVNKWSPDQGETWNVPGCDLCFRVYGQERPGNYAFFM